MIERALRLSDWRLLVAVSAAQVVTAVALRAASLPALQRALTGLRSPARFLLRGPEERVVWAIEATGRRLSRVSTCLVRAIVADLALGGPDRRLRLNIGVRRQAGGRLESHAWLVDEGDGNRVVIGGAVDDYAPLLRRTRIAT